MNLFDTVIKVLNSKGYSDDYIQDLLTKVELKVSEDNAIDAIFKAPYH